MREVMSWSFMVFIGKFKLISMRFRRDLWKIEYILFFTFYQESFRDFHSPGRKSMKRKYITFLHYLPPSPPRNEWLICLVTPESWACVTQLLLQQSSLPSEPKIFPIVILKAIFESRKVLLLPSPTYHSGVGDSIWVTDQRLWLVAMY